MGRVGRCAPLSGVVSVLIEVTTHALAGVDTPFWQLIIGGSREDCLDSGLAIQNLILNSNPTFSLNLDLDPDF